MESFLFLLLWAVVISWYFFALVYIMPRMPKRWNWRAVWLFFVLFIPALIPVELWMQRTKCEHHWKWHHNVHGDARNHVNYRTVWECTKCGKLKYERAFVHRPADTPVRKVASGYAASWASTQR